MPDTPKTGRGLLGRYFPMIRARKDIIKDIENNKALKVIYEGWNEQQKSRFLDCCTGVKGVKVLYDAFFKEVMNPEYAPDRMEDFLSLVLKQRVKVMQVLPPDSTRIADESSLLIMDIVVELSDGSVANVEVQKIGYRFPGERCACYSADLLLRQYKRVREEWDRKTAEEVPVPRKFSYQCIKNVYTIILFEKSPEAFHEFQDVFFHHSEQKTDTGLKINLLQEYNFIALDIFRKNIYNKGIQNEMDAWLAFLSEDDPEIVVEILEKYPKFRSMYEEIYDMCLNTEKVMGMFSRELKELDDNTVEYMIDELQEKLNKAEEEKQKAEEQKQKAEAEKRLADEKRQRAEEEKLRAEERYRQLVEQLQERGIDIVPPTKS